MDAYHDLAAWAEGLASAFAKTGLDPQDPLDARILEFVERAGREVSALVSAHETLQAENEALTRRVEKLENKLLAIVNMAKDVAVYAERAATTGQHGEPR